jgi:hypothetical protein
MGSIRVALLPGALEINEGGKRSVAIPSMKHPEFQRLLQRGWVSPPSFGPQGDLRIYSAALPSPRDGGYSWLASADWRRGRIQVDRRGAISDIGMEQYGGGRGKAQGEVVEIILDYARGSASLTVAELHSALGKWNADSLILEADAGAAAVVDAALASALFLWCARPEEFKVSAKPPFS